MPYNITSIDRISLVCKLIKILIYMGAVSWLGWFAVKEKKFRPKGVLWVLGTGAVFLAAGQTLDLAGLWGPVPLPWRRWAGEVFLTSFGLALVFTAACLLLASHSKLCRHLKKEVETDDLTSLANRRAFFAALKAALAGAHVEERKIGVALLDVDDLKGINDTQGHKAGDKALVRAGRALRRSVRDDDLVARIGGDEFAVLFCDTGPELEVFRERMLKELISEKTGFAGQIRLSLGFARFPDDGRDADTLFRIADARMYADKRGK